MGELSLGNHWEPLRGDPGHTFHTCSALIGLLNTFYQRPTSLMWFFWGGLLLPYSQAPVLGTSSESLWEDLLMRCWQIRLFWTATGLWWWETRGEERGEKMRRGESEEWREGEHRGAALQILRGRASHNVAPFLCPPCLFPPPPPLVCHSGLDYFILIRLIPPRGKLLITSPSHSSRRQQSPFSVRTGWG